MGRHMNKRTFSALLWAVGIFLAASSSLEAQSTLEYTTLMSTVGAAGAAKGKKAKSEGTQGEQEPGNAEGPGLVSEAAQKVFTEGSQAMSKSASLLGQVGSGMQPAGETKPATTTETPAKAAPEENPPAETNRSSAKVYLNSGTVIEGDIVERKDDYVKVNTAGIVVTYFNEEIAKIEGPSQ